MTDAMKEKLNSLDKESTEESIVNQNSFRVLSILYIINFCETKKKNSTTIQILFLLLDFQKSRKCEISRKLYFKEDAH